MAYQAGNPHNQCSESRNCQDRIPRDCNPETIPPRIDSLAQLEQNMVDRTINALDQVTAAVSGLDGRRVLVYVSDGLPMQPGAEIFQYFKPEEFITPDNIGTMRILQQSQPLDAMKSNLSSRFQAFARQTALAGVQFFARGNP